MSNLSVGDIDIDLADRNAALKLIKHIPAVITSADGSIRKHASGVYPTLIPTDPVTGWASIDYKDAEDRQYYKIDFLNNTVYQQVRSDQHLNELLAMPIPWDKLHNEEFFKKIVHIGNHFWATKKLQTPISNMQHLMMFLALIRPGKKHLLGLSWDEIAKSVWVRNASDGYTFRKAHAAAYSHLVTVHMKLLDFADKSN